MAGLTPAIHPSACVRRGPAQARLCRGRAAKNFSGPANDISTFIGSYAPVTDAPPDPVALLLQIIEDLCAAISQCTGLNLFARLLMIPVRRQLRGMKAVLADVAADAAARGPDMPPQGPIQAPIQDTSQTTPAMPVQPPRPDADALPQGQFPAALPAARSEAGGPAGACPAPGEAVASATQDAGRDAAPRIHAVPTLTPALTPPSGVVTSAFAPPAVAALRRISRASAGRRSKSDFRGGISRVLFITISE